MSGPPRDRVYRAPRGRVDAFEFNHQVAAVFDDMIRRSVPGYETSLRGIATLAARYAQSGTRVYDLGCSLGNVSATLSEAIAGLPLQDLVAVDSSPAMVERAQARLAGVEAACGFPIRVLCDDVRETPIENASVIVLNFTLQFIPLADRTPLLARLHRGLTPGGVLILSEKVRFEHPEETSSLETLHDDFRLQNGYSQLEIAQKRRALERILVTESPEAHLARLRQVGFSHCVRWFQCFNFVSFVAQADPWQEPR